MSDRENSAREVMLAKIRARLGVRGDEPGRRGLVRSRLRDPVPNLIPARARQSRSELIKLFQNMLEKQGAKTIRVRALKGLPEAITEALRENNLPSRIRVGSDPLFDALKASPGLLEILPGPAEDDGSVGLTRAVTGAAETGTLYFASGADNPSTLNFLPETHLAVILAGDICGSYEDAWAKVRSLAGKGHLPRTVNLISGPSRTADIEQTLVQGAHGPRTLIVFIAGS